MKYDEEFSFKAFDHVLKTSSHNKPYVFLVLDHPMLLHEAEQWKEKWRKLATAFDEQGIFQYLKILILLFWLFNS